MQKDSIYRVNTAKEDYIDKQKLVINNEVPCMMKTECEWMSYLKINTSLSTATTKHERFNNYEYVLHNINICNNLTDKGRWLSRMKVTMYMKLELTFIFENNVNRMSSVP